MGDSKYDPWESLEAAARRRRAEKEKAEREREIQEGERQAMLGSRVTKRSYTTSDNGFRSGNPSKKIWKIRRTPDSIGKRGNSNVRKIKKIIDGYSKENSKYGDLDFLYQFLAEITYLRANELRFHQAFSAEDIQDSSPDEIGQRVEAIWRQTGELLSLQIFPPEGMEILAKIVGKIISESSNVAQNVIIDGQQRMVTPIELLELIKNSEVAEIFKPEDLDGYIQTAKKRAASGGIFESVKNILKGSRNSAKECRTLFIK